MLAHLADHPVMVRNKGGKFLDPIFNPWVFGVEDVHSILGDSAEQEKEQEKEKEQDRVKRPRWLWSPDPMLIHIIITVAPDVVSLVDHQRPQTQAAARLNYHS